MELFQKSIQTKEEDVKRPLAYIMMPDKLEDFFGQDEILGKNKMLRNLIENDLISSMIFYGPSGCGKTTLANIISKRTDNPISYVNAVTAGVNDLRKEIKKSYDLIKAYKKKLIVVIDEIHHFNKSQQDALLPDIERGNIILIGLTTQNPFFYVNKAIISRVLVFEFKKLGIQEISEILARAIKRTSEENSSFSIKYDKEVLDYIAGFVNGDVRYAMNILEIVINSQIGKSKISITKINIDECTKKAKLSYDARGDAHYDIISAFIKSMRGSDPDATLYWLGLMLESGEDIRFIARRIAICACEDVGNAQPLAICVAESAWKLVERVGMPEARIVLAHAATFVASSPKSNASYVGIDKVISDIRKGDIKEVPNHLKDATLDKETFGHGKGYVYPHNYENAFVRQMYLNDGYKSKYYVPTDHGIEKKIKERLKNLWE